MKLSKSLDNITSYGSFIEQEAVDRDGSLGTTSSRKKPGQSQSAAAESDDDIYFFRTNYDAIKFAQRIREILDPHIKDRRWRDMKVYKNCFLHSQAVQCTMLYLNNDGKKSSNNNCLSLEQEAVNRLNELVTAGYIFHVINRHRFSVGQSKTLYFRFDDNLLASDLQKIDSSGNGIGFDRDIFQQVEDLKFTLDTMSREISSVNQMLMEANGRIAYLETKVYSHQDAIQSIIVFGYLFAIHYTIHSYEQKGQVSTMMALLFVTSVYLIVGTSSKAGMSGRNDNFVVTKIKSISNFFRPGQDCMKIDDSEEYSSLGDDSVESSSVRSLTLMNEGSNLNSSYKPKNARMTVKMREAHEIPEPELWSYRPILVCANTAASLDLKVDSSPSGICPLGVPFKFSSDLFEGICLIRLKDVRSENDEDNEKYFKGRGRKFQVVVQGRFKEYLNVSDVLTGHEFVRPIKNLPPRWILKAAGRLINSLSPGAELDITSDKPKQMANLAATSQAISADCPGNEPDITLYDFPEDLSILGGRFQEGKISSSKRKSYLSSLTHAKKYSFDTESIYTFDFYQHLLDVKSYSLDLGFTKINIAKRLNGQPIQILSKTRSGRYLWSFQIWHEHLLPKTKV